ncbi:hypothetical protein GC098_37635 [Paenibacillus sp. LMG 31458]|uniref:DUF3221 domain-containing protein n=1 Tax=Paenibacillus phytorum TaxID=2654977 RepID=A0ABX1Y7V4_9BACL|nr:hypothetical protein [Paenibacillus phytorum]NOU77020.1 hypothetical protein [Paenibacillus phytorum]
MRKLCLLFGILSITFIIASCNSQYIGNPTAKDILTNNKDSDIFMLNGIIYSNSEDIEWVNERELTLGEEVGEIKSLFAIKLKGRIVPTLLSKRQFKTCLDST